MYQEKPKNILEQGPASTRSTTMALRWQGGKKEASRQLFLEIEYLHPKKAKEPNNLRNLQLCLFSLP